MHLPHYLLIANHRSTVFNFESEGPRGKIKKTILYSKTKIRNVYNLAFGDMNLQTGKIDDLIISDNGDAPMILATVALTLYIFTKKYPEASIYIVGSTTSRTRLYQMAIGKYLNIIEADFEIYAEHDGVWKLFRKGINYKAFS
jgi:hypothetical protein